MNIKLFNFGKNISGKRVISSPKWVLFGLIGIFLTAGLCYCFLWLPTQYKTRLVSNLSSLGIEKDIMANKTFQTTFDELNPEQIKKLYKTSKIQLKIVGLINKINALLR